MRKVLPHEGEEEEEEEEGGGSYEMKGEKRLLAHVHATPSHVYVFFFSCARRDYNCSSRYPTWINVSSLPSTYLSCGALGYVHSVVQLAEKGVGREEEEEEEEKEEEGERKKATAQSNVNPKRVIFK